MRVAYRIASIPQGGATSCGLANSDAFRVHVGGAGYCLDRCGRALRIRREVEDAAGWRDREAFVAAGGYSADITQGAARNRGPRNPTLRPARDRHQGELSPLDGPRDSSNACR